VRSLRERTEINIVRFTRRGGSRDVILMALGICYSTMTSRGHMHVESGCRTKLWSKTSPANAQNQRAARSNVRCAPLLGGVERREQLDLAELGAPAADLQPCPEKAVTQAVFSHQWRSLHTGAGGSHRSAHAGHVLS
jgi:hypothetical protein